VSELAQEGFLTVWIFQRTVTVKRIEVPLSMGFVGVGGVLIWDVLCARFRQIRKIRVSCRNEFQKSIVVLGFDFIINYLC
jgi:hypothetical protein